VSLSCHVRSALHWWVVVDSVPPKVDWKHNKQVNGGYRGRVRYMQYDGPLPVTARTRHYPVHTNSNQTWMPCGSSIEPPTYYFSSSPPAGGGFHSSCILTIFPRLTVYTAMQSAHPGAPGSPVMRSRSTTVSPHARRPSSSQWTGASNRCV